jgi:hypothetical protein
MSLACLLFIDFSTAHVTGTTVHLGEQLIRGNWSAATLAGSIVLAFLVGSVAAAR